MSETEPDQDAVVIGWLRGDDYEAALAFRHREPCPDLPRRAHTWLAHRLGGRRPEAEHPEA